MRSRLAAGASDGTNTVQGTPKACAAAARPAPWLPALEATTPWARAAGPSCATTFIAPRTLNEPVRCSHSHLSHTSPPRKSERPGDRTSGVRATCGAMRSAARRTREAEGRTDTGGWADARGAPDGAPRAPIKLSRCTRSPQANAQPGAPAQLSEFFAARRPAVALRRCGGHRYRSSITRRHRLTFGGG